MKTVNSSAVVLASQKSNFSQKCTLLSQYLKENASLGDFRLGLLATPTTKNLLPMIEKSCPVVHQVLNLPPKGQSKEMSQMTIFYKGKVTVFENFPAEKAKEIMGFASKESSMSPQNHNTTNNTEFVAPNTPFRNPLAEGDMPIMRNRSLARFIAKRKDRIRSKAPYQTTNGSDGSNSYLLDDHKTWLGLAAQSSSYQNDTTINSA